MTMGTHGMFDQQSPSTKLKGNHGRWGWGRPPASPLQLCPCVPVVIYIPCVPVVICVPVQFHLIMTSYTKPYILISCEYTTFFAVSLFVHINRLSGLPTLEHATYNCPWEKQSVFSLYLIILMIAFELCCSCVPVSWSSFIFPVSRSSFVSRCPSL